MYKICQNKQYAYKTKYIDIMQIRRGVLQYSSKNISLISFNNDATLESLFIILSNNKDVKIVESPIRSNLSGLTYYKYSSI